MEGHVGGQHHVYDEGAELPELVPGQVLEDVAFFVTYHSGNGKWSALGFVLGGMVGSGCAT